MAWTIRRLASSDLPQMRRLNDLFGRAFDDAATYGGTPPDDAYLRHTLGKEHVIVLVAAEDDEAVLGGLVAYELDKLESRRREIYVYDLAVDAGHRRRGIATALIRALAALARTRGVWTIFVQADHGDEPAIALYGKAGIREEVLHFDLTPSDVLQPPGKEEV